MSEMLIALKPEGKDIPSTTKALFKGVAENYKDPNNQQDTLTGFSNEIREKLKIKGPNYVPGYDFSQAIIEQALHNKEWVDRRGGLKKTSDDFLRFIEKIGINTQDPSMPLKRLAEEYLLRPYVTNVKAAKPDSSLPPSEPPPTPTTEIVPSPTPEKTGKAPEIPKKAPASVNAQTSAEEQTASQLTEELNENISSYFNRYGKVEPEQSNDGQMNNLLILRFFDKEKFNQLSKLKGWPSGSKPRVRLKADDTWEMMSFQSQQKDKEPMATTSIKTPISIIKSEETTSIPEVKEPLVQEETPTAEIVSPPAPEEKAPEDVEKQELQRAVDAIFDKFPGVEARDTVVSESMRITKEQVDKMSEEERAKFLNENSLEYGRLYVKNLHQVFDEYEKNKAAVTPTKKPAESAVAAETTPTTGEPKKGRSKFFINPFKRRQKQQETQTSAETQLPAAEGAGIPPTPVPQTVDAATAQPASVAPLNPMRDYDTSLRDLKSAGEKELKAEGKMTYEELKTAKDSLLAKFPQEIRSKAFYDAEQRTYKELQDKFGDGKKKADAMTIDPHTSMELSLNNLRKVYDEYEKNKTQTTKTSASPSSISAQQPASPVASAVAAGTTPATEAQMPNRGEINRFAELRRKKDYGILKSNEQEELRMYWDRFDRLSKPNKERVGNIMFPPR